MKMRAGVRTKLYMLLSWKLIAANHLLVMRDSTTARPSVQLGVYWTLCTARHWLASTASLQSVNEKALGAFRSEIWCVHLHDQTAWKWWNMRWFMLWFHFSNTPSLLQRNLTVASLEHTKKITARSQQTAVRHLRSAPACEELMRQNSSFCIQNLKIWHWQAFLLHCESYETLWSILKI